MRGEANAKNGSLPKERRQTGCSFVAVTIMNALKEYLEELMDLKRPASITFRPVEGGLSTVKGHVVKMENVSGRDIIETDTGLVIGTDQIAEVNGRKFENIC